MEQLKYEGLNRSFLTRKHKNIATLEIGSHRSNTHLKEKVLQFGEGNFLRAFIDFFIDELNGSGYFNGSVVVVQPIAQGLADVVNAQDGCYTVVLRGLENNEPTVRERLVTSISRAINPYENFDEYMKTMKNPELRFIVSNTTEAGIAFLETDKLTDSPPASFPAKVTALLYERYKLFNGDNTKGFIFIPGELIDDNGTKLKEFVLTHAKNWQLPQAFIDWINTANHFTNTLVDRIVTGYPKDEAAAFAETLGYRDDLLVTGEIFHFFAIEAGKEATAEIEEALPFHKANQNVVLTQDATPYKLRKVRILNGAHTMSVLAAFLCGKDTVGEMMEDPLFTAFLRRGIYEEIIPTLDLPESDLLSFADSVFDRFANPYIKHYLLSIALNSVSKFKTRVLPSILEYHKRKGAWPKALTLSFAALLAFYRGTVVKENALIGTRAEGEYPIADSAEILEFFKLQWQRGDIDKLVNETLAKVEFWNADLTQLPGLSSEVTSHLRGILTHGVKKEIEAIL